MSRSDLIDWLFEQTAFKEEYKKLLINSVASQFPLIIDSSINLDWNYLLKCASFFSKTKKGNTKDIALRISQYCLQCLESTSLEQKAAAQFILNEMGNRMAIRLAEQKGLIEENEDKWAESFIGNLNWLKDETNHSVWLRNGERINVNLFQRDFWDALNTHKVLSISAPTSAGKSFLIKKWILEKISESKTSVITYLVPTRALIAEVESDFHQLLTEEIKQSKVNVTSIPFLNLDEGEEKSRLYILTQERFQLLLQRSHRPVEILIVDEAYKLGDGPRGILLQYVIEKARRINPDIKIIYISPHASNPEILIDTEDGFSDRYEDVTVNQNLIWATQVRGAKWKLELCHSDERIPIGEIQLPANPSPASLKLPMLAFSLGKSGGNILYVNGPADAEKAAQQLCDLIGFSNRIEDPRLNALIELCEKTIHKDYRLAEVLKYGVAFHYGNIPLLIREEVENLFREGAIKYLVCTSTLIEGVNLPCRNIFIRIPKRGPEPLNSGDFWNLAGRAGRWGKEFQGNIICIDPITWNAPQEKSLTEINLATRDVLKRENDLIRFIDSDTPRNEAATKEGRSLESMASYLAISYISFGSIKRIPWITQINSSFIEQLETKVSEKLIISDIPEEIIANHPGISPLAMQKMLAFFTHFKEMSPNITYENLLTPYATDTDALSNFIFVFTNFYDRLTNEFGNNVKHLYQEALITICWMQGWSIKRIIEARHRKVPNESIHETIRKVLDLIETVARYRAPKYLSCYNELLKFYLEKIGETEIAQEVEDLSLYLEMGVNTKTHLSLLNLGLSRTSAVEIKEYITLDSLTEKECLAWFSNPNNNWAERDLPVIVKRDIARMLTIHLD